MDTLLALDAPPTSTPSGTSPSTPAKPRIKEHRQCRVCGAGRLYTYLDLGEQALANAFRDPDAPISEELRVPLRLQACMTCKLSQLSHVVTSDANTLDGTDDAQAFMRVLAQRDEPTTLEVPYIGFLLDSLAFDMIQHTRVSYWSVTALHTLAKRCDMHVNDVRFLRNTQTMCVTLSKSATQSETVVGALTDELHDLKRNEYLRFSARVTTRIAEICEELLAATPYVGYGAGAKASVMLQCMDVRAYPRVVYDESERKWFKQIPGTRVGIEAPPPEISMEGPLVMFAWNRADSIIPRLRKSGYRGAILVPLPRPRWDVIE